MARIVLKPTTEKLSLVTLSRLGQTGGGGTISYSTETALLASSPPDGTIGYAQDTDAFWNRKGGAWAQSAPVPGTPVQGIGGANAQGAAPTLALSDHDHKLRETSGPTDLSIGAVADGEFLKRSGGSIVGGPAGSGVTYPTEAGLLADSPANGSAAYAQDTGSFWFRRLGVWEKGSSADIAKLSATQSFAGANTFSGSLLSPGVGADSFKAGPFANSGGPNSLAIGSGVSPSARALGDSAIAVGNNNTKSDGFASVGIGWDVRALADLSVALGASISVPLTSTGSVGLGSFVTLNGNFSVGIGYAASVQQSAGVAIGFSSFAGAGSSVAIGPSSSVLYSLSAPSTAAVAIGSGAVVSYNSPRSVVIGASQTNDSGTAVDTSSSVVIGDTSRSKGRAAIAIGRTASADYDNSIAIGEGAAPTGPNKGEVGSGAALVDLNINGKLSMTGDTFKIGASRTIVNAGDAGAAGDIAWDADYLYVCVAANTWKRTPLATWP